MFSRYKSANMNDIKFNFDNQSREVKGRNDGARISNLNKTDNLISYYYEDGKTLYEIFLKGQAFSNNGEYLGVKPAADKPFKWFKYSKVYEIAQSIGSALIKIDLIPAKLTFIGIFAKNRPEWVMIEHACNMFSFVSVPLYETLGDEAVEFILLQTELKIVFCDDSNKAMSLMKNKSCLQCIVIIEELTDVAREKASQLNIQITSLENFINLGKSSLQKPIPPKPEDVATICYTSGTTGKPKGAVITHENIVSNSASILSYVHEADLISNEQDRYLSYLPLAHMLERVAHSVVCSLGGKIGFFQGDIKLLIEDIKELKPTIFVTVPRLLNRVYSTITENIEKSSSVKKRVFRWAFKHKEKRVLKGIVRTDSIYDFAFKKIRESLGGSVKILVSGSAPISPDVLHFMRVCTGCHVLEGYGATETGGASSIQIPGERTVGNIGPPFICCMYKLADVPEMNIVAKRDNKGEIYIRGKNIFKGYFKDEEKTKEALDNDGWYHTGDIGIWEKNGTLKIVDRVKNIFKLQQGEYIAPEKIENIYIRSKYVAQVFVYGNSLKSTLICVIVPEESSIIEWANEKNQVANMQSLCKNEELKKEILKDITSHGKNGGLKGFEQVKDLHLHSELFTIENGLLTPTMKSKRNELEKLFKKELAEMYKNLD